TTPALPRLPPAGAAGLAAQAAWTSWRGCFRKRSKPSRVVRVLFWRRSWMGRRGSSAAGRPRWWD
ncbi:hypothetical protein LTR66_006791, partial [Elasticomyces elasticus]